MADPAVIVEKDGHVLIVTLNRPEKRNAVNSEVMCRLSDAWHQLDEDDDLRVAILTGTGTALIMTTVVLVTGFTTVLFSDLREQRIFAAMGGLTIATALAQIGDAVGEPLRGELDRLVAPLAVDPERRERGRLHPWREGMGDRLAEDGEAVHGPIIATAQQLGLPPAAAWAASYSSEAARNSS